MAGLRQGPSPRERLIATATALLLHLAVLCLWPWPRPSPRPARPVPPPIPVEIFRLAGVAAARPPSPALTRRSLGIRPARHGTLPTEVRVAEREIIDQGHGVTMTIEGAGASPPPAKVPEKPAPWLPMDVWVPEPLVPPRPSEYCVPRLPRMPDRAIDGGVTGKVDASWVVDEIGQPSDVHIEPGAHPVLAWAVRNWIRGCLFLPAQQGGRRTTARVKQTFLFEIQ